MKDDKEKAQEILKLREQARKGIEPEQPKDPLEAEEVREEKIVDLGLGLGIGLRR